jgi:hypothetical protein
VHHEFERNAAGAWSWYGDQARQIAGHAAQPGGPLTVFWAGDVSGERLRDFVSNAATALTHLGVHAQRFATVLLTDSDEIQLENDKTPEFPDATAKDAGFVRFEFGPAGEAPDVLVRDHAFAAWARLDHPASDELDAIGIYCAPGDMRLLRHEIAQLVRETSHSHLPADFVADVLARLEADLGVRTAR